MCYHWHCGTGGVVALLQCQLRIQMNEGLSQEPWLSWVDAGQKLRLLQMANRAGDDGLCKHFTITEKASTRAFSLLKPFLALSHCQTGVNPTRIDVKLDCQCKEKKGQVVLRIYVNQPAHTQYFVYLTAC